jgi:predicted secreted Zn-dependent protease
MARHKKTFLLYLLLLQSPVNAIAEPAITTRYVYYQVSGHTAEDIWADIRKKSPVKHFGRLHVAYTKWNVNWKFWWHGKADDCRISRVTTALDVVYTMPKLKPDITLADALMRQWEQYYAALFSHEQGHKDLGEKAAIEIENAISGMTPHDSCERLQNAANEMGKNVINKYRLIEKDYDRSTNHGLNTGVVFPLTAAGD